MRESNHPAVFWRNWAHWLTCYGPSYQPAAGQLNVGAAYPAFATGRLRRGPAVALATTLAYQPLVLAARHPRRPSCWLPY